MPQSSSQDIGDHFLKLQYQKNRPKGTFVSSMHFVRHQNILAHFLAHIFWSLLDFVLGMFPICLVPTLVMKQT